MFVDGLWLWWYTVCVMCIHVNVGPSQTFSKKYSEINAKNLQYNVHVILAGMYIKKKVYLKNTNRASIKKITDFGMILRPYKLLVIAKVQRRWYTSECWSVCGSGSEHLGEAQTAHSMGVASAYPAAIWWKHLVKTGTYYYREVIVRLTWNIAAR